MLKHSLIIYLSNPVNTTELAKKKKKKSPIIRGYENVYIAIIWHLNIASFLLKHFTSFENHGLDSQLAFTGATLLILME